MSILPMQLQVDDGVCQVTIGRPEFAATFAGCASLESAFQAGHCRVGVLVNFRLLQMRRYQLCEFSKALHYVDGGLGLLDGVLGVVRDGVHVRELVLDPSFLASDLTSLSA